MYLPSGADLFILLSQALLIPPGRYSLGSPSDRPPVYEKLDFCNCLCRGDKIPSSFIQSHKNE